MDVFYVYPTVSNNVTGLMDVTNPEERALAEGAFLSQASVFASHANIFAPPLSADVFRGGRPVGGV
ncbi:DUF3089 domain-containing protein [Methanogenium cariaci]|uniref:DUF3089 domain-containing protein n=1 Tax=Methanogenium cariaci TaxID=2197 RepID=UPI002481521D|nr:DUF3089 domain-containing protein [Methanogenium cariaci]